MSASGGSGSGDGGWPRVPQWPQIPWGIIGSAAAAGVLLLAVFVAQWGSVLALVITLAMAVLLIAGALLAARSHPGRRASPGQAPTLPPARAARPSRPENDPLAVFREVEDVGQVTEPEPPAHPQRPGQTGPPTITVRARQPLPPVPTGGPGRLGGEHLVSGASGEAARELARLAITRWQAPAAAVLIPLEGRLTAIGTAGDWTVARHRPDEPSIPGLALTEDLGEPPQFPLDPRNDWLLRLLALQSRPIVMERWHELSDVPVALLPLAAFSASGTAVAMPLISRRRLIGLWVLARRPGEHPYSDDDLTALARVARDAAHTLGASLGH